MLYVHVCSCQAIWYVRGVFTVLVTIAFEGGLCIPSAFKCNNCIHV